MDPRHDLKAKLARNREQRVAQQRDSMRGKFAEVLQEQENLMVALRLMGERGSSDPFLEALRHHVDQGLPLPEALVARLRRRIEKGPSEPCPLDQGTIYELLNAATIGLRGKDWSFAHDLLTQYEQGSWSDSQFHWATVLLWKAKGGIRKVI